MILILLLMLLNAGNLECDYLFDTFQIISDINKEIDFGSNGYKSYDKFEVVEEKFENFKVELVHSLKTEEDILMMLIFEKDEMGIYKVKQIINVEYERGMAWDIKQSIFVNDVNFDGNLDIEVNLGHFGNQGVNLYAVYLFDNGSFVANEDFFIIQNLAIDYTNNLLLGSWRNNASSHGHGIYKFENNKLVISKSLDIFWNKFENEINGEIYYIEKYVVKEYKDNEIITETTYTAEKSLENELKDMFLNEKSEWGIYTDKWISIAYLKDND